MTCSNNVDCKADCRQAPPQPEATCMNDFIHATNSRVSYQYLCTAKYIVRKVYSRTDCFGAATLSYLIPDVCAPDTMVHKGSSLTVWCSNA